MINEKLTIEELREFQRLFEKITQRATDIAEKRNQLRKVYIGSDRFVSNQYVECVAEVEDNEFKFYTVEDYDGEKDELRYSCDELIKGE